MMATSQEIAETAEVAGAEDGAWDTGGLWVNVEKMARADARIRTGNPAWNRAPLVQLWRHQDERQALRAARAHPSPQRRGREYAP